MKTTKPSKPQPLPADWDVHDSYGVRIVRGTELTVRGLRRKTLRNPEGIARVVFVRHVKTPTAEWIDVIDARQAGWRSVHPSAIRTVHNIRKAYPS